MEYVSLAVAINNNNKDRISKALITGQPLSAEQKLCINVPKTTILPFMYTIFISVLVLIHYIFAPKFNGALRGVVYNWHHHILEEKKERERGGKRDLVC